MPSPGQLSIAAGWHRDQWTLDCCLEIRDEEPLRRNWSLHSYKSFNVTIKGVDGGYSSAAERLTVAQDVVGSIPTSRPNDYQPGSKKG